VVNVTASLKRENATVYHGIFNKILKYCANLIGNSFTYVCNSSLASGIYPERCKYALVWPIYKKEDKSYISNFRPVSLLLSLSMVLEKLMMNRLNQQFQSNKVPVPEHFGFRRKSNIKNAIFTLTDPIDSR
jgi:hypothetical protein